MVDRRTVLAHKPKTEDQEQAEFVSAFRKTYSARIFAIPNGGKRSIQTASKLKLTGVSAGVPDLYIPEWKLWVEMKIANGGRVSPAQADWHQYLISIGDTVIVTAGCDDALKQVAAFLESR